MTVADTSENKAHRAACAASQQTLNAAVDAALALQRAGGTSAAAAATIKAAEIANYQRIVASCLANGAGGAAEFAQAAAEVGTHA
jgi:hypothetical protein